MTSDTLPDTVYAGLTIKGIELTTDPLALNHDHVLERRVYRATPATPDLQGAVDDLVFGYHILGNTMYYGLQRREGSTNLREVWFKEDITDYTPTAMNERFHRIDLIRNGLKALRTPQPIDYHLNALRAAGYDVTICVGGE